MKNRPWIVTQILIAHAFRDLGGAAPFQAECREMHIDSSNMLAEPDPWEVFAIASRLSKIDRVAMAWIGFRSDEDFRVANRVD